jgi:hypothetical protein
MALIELTDAQAWVEDTKLGIDAFDESLLAQVEAQLLGRLSAGFDLSTWVGPGTTPDLVKSAIAMTYASWLYNKHYSEDQENLNDYAVWLLGQANAIMTGLIDGSITVPGVEAPTVGAPSFYPNDSSSALAPTWEDPSLGGASFSMGQRF